MPTMIPHVTMDPAVHLPSTWKDGLGKPLTDSAILAYIRQGRYGPDLQRRQLARDKATVVDGRTMLARECQECHERLGSFMRFAYLPRAGYYCDHCRNEYKTSKEKAEAQRRRYRDGSAFE